MVSSTAIPKRIFLPLPEPPPASPTGRENLPFLLFPLKCLPFCRLVITSGRLLTSTATASRTSSYTTETGETRRSGSAQERVFLTLGHISAPDTTYYDWRTLTATAFPICCRTS